MRENGLFHYAVTDTSILLFWEKFENVLNGCLYMVYVNEKIAGITKKTHFTVEGLREDTDYRIELYWQKADNSRVCFGGGLVRTAKRKGRLDISKPPYNAVGDAKTINTVAIQRALDDCTEKEEVYIPAGNFMTGALRMHSDTTLYLEKGAILQGTNQVQDYLPKIPSRFEGMEMECYSSLINLGNRNHAGGANCENVLIYGKGTIASGGKTLAMAVIEREREYLKDFLEELGSGIDAYEKPETIPGRLRPRLINISNCKNIRISGLTLENGASWNVHMIYSEDILTDHCVFRSENVWNGDGWDPDSSKNCTIFACTFYTGDDSIAIKSGKNPEGNEINRPCEHIRIFDCICKKGHGFAIGSEMSGGVRDVKIWDCDLTGSKWGLEIKGTKKRGGYVRDVHVRDCVMPSILFHSVSYNDDGRAAQVPPVFEQCSFTDVTLYGQGGKGQDGTAIELCGFDVPGYEIKKVLFRRVKILESGDGEKKIILKHCKNIQLEEITAVSC